MDGIDYHFVSKAQFESWIQNDQLLEHAIVYGEYKGIPRPQAGRLFVVSAICLLR